MGEEEDGVVNKTADVVRGANEAANTATDVAIGATASGAKAVVEVAKEAGLSQDAADNIREGIDKVALIAETVADKDKEVVDKAVDFVEANIEDVSQKGGCF